MDAVALDQAHGAGVEIRPDRFGTVAGREPQEVLGHRVERLVPVDAAELAAACRRVMEAQGLTKLSAVVVEAAANWMAPARLAA